MSTKLGIIGCGKMGSALLKGVIAANAIDPSKVFAFDHYLASAQAIAAATGAQIADSNSDLVSKSDAILLCVKPQDMLKMLRELGETGAGKLFISIAAGITINSLEATLPSTARVIRVMPNTPALIGQGASGYSPGSNTTPEDISLTETLLTSVGTCIQVSEPLLGAVTGLSGSGPAYVYTIIEALADGGVLCGLPRDKALQLAAQTVAGAANMVLQTGEHPATLRDQVTSPGGTTIAGLKAIEIGKLRATLIQAVEASANRAQELAG